MPKDASAACLPAFRFRRQGLPRLLPPDPAAVLRRAGWVHTAGGQGPYLALQARAALDREAVDQALAAGSICEVPSVRRCTFLVPAEDAALALQAGRAAQQAAVAEVTKLCAVPERELAALGEAILSALEDGPLDPRGLHERLPGPLVRSLGEAGRKQGYATTLPLALAQLAGSGQVRRIPETGRLDTQRFRYARWHRSPLPRPAPEELLRELARCFLRWAGPATVKDFAFFAGLTQKEARPALAGPRTVEVGEQRLLLAEDRDEFRQARAAPQPAFVLLPMRDNFTHLHRNLMPLVDPAHAKQPVLDWGKGTVPLGAAKSLHQPAIVRDGVLCGLWDYDPEAREIAWRTFDRLPPPELQALQAEVARARTFICDQLGDYRFYSLDNEKNRQHRLAALRAT